MIVGGYQISNALIAVLLVVSSTGAGIATNSFSGISDSVPGIMPDNSQSLGGNQTSSNNTSDNSNNSGDSSNSGTDQTSDGSGNSGSSPGSSDESDSSNSEDGGGFLDDILGGGKEDNQKEDQEQEENKSDNETENDNQETTNETDETLPEDNETASTVEISKLIHPKPAQYTQPYESAVVPLEVVLTGENAQYEITVNGNIEVSGELSGEQEINRSVELSNTGMHDLTIRITRSGETLEKLTRTFGIAEDAIQQTGFERTTSVTTGRDATFRLWDNGELVSDATVFLGDTQKQTDQDGEVTFVVPYQQNITLSTEYSGIQDRTFEVTQNMPEPEITLTGPVDGETFETPTGTDKDVKFEASIDISENSGTASLIIDGSETYTQELSQGDNSISTTQSLSAGTHNWQIEVSTPEYNTSSDQRTLTVNEIDVQNGLSLKFNATAGDTNYAILYENGEPIQGAEITVNGNSIGSTNSEGEVGFTVPNKQQITVSSSSPDYDKTYVVEGYDAGSAVEMNIVAPTDGESIDSYKIDFEWAVNTNGSFSTTLFVDGNSRYSNTSSESSNFRKELIIDESGSHSFQVKTDYNGSTFTTSKKQFDTSESAPAPTIQINEPTEGSSYTDHWRQFDFTIDSVYPYNSSLIVDGFTVEEFTRDGAQDIPYPVFWGVKDGQSTAEVTYSSNRYSQDLSKTVTFTTNDQRPISDNILRQPMPDPQSGTVSRTGPDVDLLFDIDAYTALNYEVVFSKDGSNETKDSGNLEKGQHTLEPTVNLQPGSYEWFVRTEANGKTRTSETWNLEVE